ncbi:MAG: Hpt domain-containing protein [Methylococcales bacterium]|nr:Hpt domain-containing protein [Methylococcales bacterium]
MTNVAIDESLIFTYEQLSGRLMDNETLIYRVAKAFLKEMPEQVDQLRGCVKNKETKEIALLAHKIKGSSAIIGAIRLSRVAGKMERAGREDDKDVLTGHLTELEQSVIPVIEMMEGIVAKADC